MGRLAEAVKAFHVRMNRDYSQALIGEVPELQDLGRALISRADDIDVDNADRRYLRAHLMLEELGETLVSMGEGNELRTFDGFCDLLYVLIGSGVTFDLPIEEGFDEVHRSNMTKTAKADDTRIRDKGKNYSPPNLDFVLDMHRTCRPLDLSGISELHRDLLVSAREALRTDPKNAVAILTELKMVTDVS